MTASHLCVPPGAWDWLPDYVLLSDADLLLMEVLLCGHMEGRELIRENQHGFTKGKSCLTNLVASCHGVTASVHKGRATDDICLHVAKS